MTTVDERDGNHGATFWIGIAVGWTVIGFGTVGALNSVWLRDRPGDLVRWLLGGLVLHDAVLVPLVTVAGLLVAKLAPRWLRGPIDVALVLSGLVLLFAYPLLRAFGRRESNPSILPLDYGRNVAIVLLLIWLGAAALAAVKLVERRRS
jgi:hypothetical protein